MMIMNNENSTSIRVVDRQAAVVARALYSVESDNEMRFNKNDGMSAWATVRQLINNNNNLIQIK